MNERGGADCVSPTTKATTAREALEVAVEAATRAGLTWAELQEAVAWGSLQGGSLRNQSRAQRAVDIDDIDGSGCDRDHVDEEDDDEGADDAD
jgi:hypothetical protein